MFNNKSDNAEEILNPSLINPIHKERALKAVVNIDDFPVHTMRSELKALALDKSKPEFIVRKSASPMLASDTRPIENAPKNSHFQASIERDEKDESRSNLGKIFLIITTVLILIIIVAGGYYFWMTRMNNTQNSPSTTIPTSEETITNSTPQQISPSFSQNQANYLSLDISTMSASDIKETLKKYANQVSQIKDSGPIEFVVTDKMNNPVSFQDFSQKAGLVFPPDILSQLSQVFSLYIYTDNTYPRLGITILTKNNDTLKIALSQEEKNLPQDLQALFIDPIYKPGNATPFSSSTYGGGQIRYANIPPSVNISIDYTILNGQLIIGTSKNTERAIIDYVMKTLHPTAR